MIFKNEEEEEITLFYLPIHTYRVDQSVPSVSGINFGKISEMITLGQCSSTWVVPII